MRFSLEDQAMYRRLWTYYPAAQSRHVAQPQPQPSWTAQKHEVAFDRADDLWIFSRLASVLAAFSEGTPVVGP